jgi:arylsulfatase A-like enzyme
MRNLNSRVLKRAFLAGALSLSLFVADATQPNIVLIMTDDQGWGQTGYYDHPVLKTPNLDAMAANGLRFDRFYAAAPVCSPSRASVLTGRTNDRSGVFAHGHALRRQELTLAVALKAVGYTTGHFGKWHLNGLRGPGVPVLVDDPHGPGAFGFDEWVTVTNFFDIDPLMSRQGVFEEFTGDSSAVIVAEALQFIRAHKDGPFLAVVWDGSPHEPFIASAADQEPFDDLDTHSRNHYGELVAFDRALGVFRKGLRDLGVADNTLVWFCSDNGGLKNIVPDTVGGLRGNKGTVWEGGIRVPAIIEWPAAIMPRVTDYPASTMDIFPTIADLLDLPPSALLNPVDGTSIAEVFKTPLTTRDAPIPFRFGNSGAWVDNAYKLVVTDIEDQTYQLFDLTSDPGESKDIAGANPERFNSMKSAFQMWNESVQGSVDGQDYPEGRLDDGEPIRRFWWDDERYTPYLDALKQRPEYAPRLN